MLTAMSRTGPESVLESATALADAGEPADAAELLATALLTGPPDPDRDAELLRALADADIALGWDGTALALLAEAQRVAPGDPAVVGDRVRRLCEHGRYGEALAA